MKTQQVVLKKNMICPFCAHEDSKVLDKRDFGGITKRRRECLSCAKRFNTRENLEEVALRVIKKDGRREDFDREKIKRGIMRACEKRPISAEVVEKMIINVEEKVRKRGGDLKTMS